MDHKIYCIFDVKAKAYMQPWFMPNDSMASRAFQDCVSDPQHTFGAHPEDYTLFNIGTFNQITGEIIPTDKTSLGNGLDHFDEVLRKKMEEKMKEGNKK